MYEGITGMLHNVEEYALELLRYTVYNAFSLSLVRGRLPRRPHRGSFKTYCFFSPVPAIPASDDDAAAVVVVVVANDVVRKNRQQLTHKHVGGWDRRYIPENRNTILDSSCV